MSKCYNTQISSLFSCLFLLRLIEIEVDLATDGQSASSFLLFLCLKTTFFVLHLGRPL
jgi:hypothetical protein